MDGTGHVKEGDSGAPWFINNAGVGVTHGYIISNNHPVFSKLVWADDGLGAGYQVLLKGHGPGWSSLPRWHSWRGPAQVRKAWSSHQDQSVRLDQTGVRWPS